MGGDILKTFRRSYWGPANRGQIQVPKTGVCGSFTAETFPGLRGSAIRVPVWTSNTKILSKNLKSDFQILATLKDRAESNMDLRIHIHTDIGQVWLAQILPCKTEVALQGTLSSLFKNKMVPLWWAWPPATSSMLRANKMHGTHREPLHLAAKLQAFLACLSSQPALLISDCFLHYESNPIFICISTLHQTVCSKFPQMQIAIIMDSWHSGRLPFAL